MTSEELNVMLAIDLAIQGGQVDGAHHKQWYLNQILRILTGDDYDRVVRAIRSGEDGPNTFEWSRGVPP